MEQRSEAAVGGGWTNAGITGQYFPNTGLTAPASFTRKDVRLDFGTSNPLSPGGSISPSFQAVGPQNWSAHWTGQFIPRFSETYTFKAYADDSLVVKARPAGGSTWVTVINQASYTGSDTTGTYGPLTAGQAYDIDITFVQAGGPWGLRLRWQSASTPEEVIDTLSQSGYDNPDGKQIFRDMVKSARNSWNGPSGHPAPAMDANGWPMGDGNYTFQESLNEGLDIDPLMQGTVAFSFNGSATVSLQGNCKGLTYSYDGPSNTTSGTFTVFPNHWNASYFIFANSHRDGTPTGPGGITNLKLMRPTAPSATTSYDPTDPSPFTPQMIAALSHFNVVRYQYVANQQKEWTDRTLPSYFNQAGGTTTAAQYGVGSASSNGISWEHKVMLANETGRDIMISIPTVASGRTAADTASYIYNLANLFRYGSDGTNPYTQATANPVYPPLNANLRVYLELENELWNYAGVFGTDYGNLNAITAADADAGNADFLAFNYDNLTTTKDANGNYNSLGTWRYRKIVLRMVQISNIFRSVFGDGAMPATSINPRVRPLYEWQYANTNNTASLGLSFADNYFNNADGVQHSSPARPISYYLWGGGGASYYGAVNGEGLTSLITNPDFASPSVAAGYNQAPTGGSWSFTGTAGIANGGSAGGGDFPPAYKGSQLGYVTDTGSMSINVTFPSSQTSNLYGVSFKAANRLKSGASAGDTEKIRVYLDDTTDITAKTASQGNGYVPPKYNSGAPWEAQNVWWTWSSYYYTQAFAISPGSTHKITIAGLGSTSGTNQTVFLGEVQVTSVDAIFAGGIPGGGEATGQPLGENIISTMQTEASWAKVYGLEQMAYESGWSLGGDDGGSWIQLKAKYGDSRTIAAQETFMQYFYQSGSAVDMFGTYDQWPSWSDYYAEDGILNIGTYPIIQGIDAYANALTPEATNGSAIPAALGLASATLGYHGSITSGSISAVGGWVSWNVIAPVTGLYNVSAGTSGGGSLSIDVDGTSIGTVANTATALVAAPFNVILTKGFHVIRVRSTAGTFTVSSIAVNSGTAPTNGPAVEVFGFINQPANSTSAAPLAVGNGLTASSVVIGPGLKPANYGGLPNMSGCLQAGMKNNQGATSLTDAKTKGTYYLFSLAPQAGNALSLGAIAYLLSTDDGSHLFSSVAWSTDGTNFNDVPTSDVPQSWNSIHNGSATLNGVPALQNAAGTVSIRIYIWGIGGYNTIGLGETGYNAAILYGAVDAAGIDNVVNDNGGFTSTGMQLNGGASISGTTLTLTDGGATEARSAYYATPVSVQQFSTAFTFKQINPSGDGFAFVLQNAGPTAVGSSGGGLGYTGMVNSVAVKFDLYNNAGEGSNSTGLYVGGSSVTTPATDLSPSGINLHNGNPVQVQISYDGTTLTVRERDTVTNATAVQTYAVNIAQAVGAATAYAGFTASTGGATSTQQILDWTYSGQPDPLPTGWADLDIGSPAIAGDGVYDSAIASWTVEGGGGDIWGASDQFNFVSTATSGDKTIIAKVAGITNTDPWAKAGVMFRNNSAAGSMMTCMLATPGNGVIFEWRNATGGSCASYGVSVVPAPSTTQPVWVKLSKSGTTYTGYYSLDGANWMSVGSTTVTFTNANYLGGLAVTAHNNGGLNTVGFANVSGPQ